MSGREALHQREAPKKGKKDPNRKLMEQIGITDIRLDKRKKNKSEYEVKMHGQKFRLVLTDHQNRVEVLAIRHSDSSRFLASADRHEPDEKIEIDQIKPFFLALWDVYSEVNEVVVREEAESALQHARILANEKRLDSNQVVMKKLGMTDIRLKNRSENRLDYDVKIHGKAHSLTITEDATSYHILIERKSDMQSWSETVLKNEAPDPLIRVIRDCYLQVHQQYEEEEEEAMWARRAARKKAEKAAKRWFKF